MSRDEVKELLKVVTRYDNRPPSNETLDAWFASANIAGWTLPEATEAVARHFTYSTDYLRPAHVTILIDAKRSPARELTNSQTVSEALALTGPKPEPAEPEWIRSLVDRMGNRMGWERKKSKGPEVSPVECPVCHAMPDKACVRQQHRGPHKGRYVPLAKVHPSRAELERKAIS